MNINDLYENLLKKPLGSEFIKCDLHLHFEPINSDDENLKKHCKKLYKILNKHQVKLVALTVHRQQDLELLFKGIKYLNEFNESNDFKILFFPAIELKDSNNIHFAIIFNKNLSISEIGNLLGAIGRKKEQNNRLNRDQCDIVKKSLSGDNIEILNNLLDYKAISFFPHPLTNDGIATNITGESLKIYMKTPLTYLWNLGNPSTTKVDESNKSKSCPKKLTLTPQRYGTEKEFKNLARIKVSDAHDLKLLDDIYSICPLCSLYDYCNIGYTYLKLSKNDINALKQLEYDPNTRIKFDISNIHKHPFIEGLYVKGEFFQEQYFRFNPELNVLVGGRGTGKSLIIDLIRFACNSIPKDEDYFKIFINKLIKQLGNEGKIVLFYKINNEKILAIKKVLLINENVREIDFNNDVKIKFYKKYKDSPFLDEEIVDNKQIISIEALSQTEISAIHKKTSSLLNIIDAFIPDFEEKMMRESMISKVENLKSELLGKYKDYDKILQKKQEYDELNLRLEEKNKFLQKIENLNLEIYRNLHTIDNKLIQYKSGVNKWFNDLSKALNYQFENNLFSELDTNIKLELEKILKIYSSTKVNLIKFQEKAKDLHISQEKEFEDKYNKMLTMWNQFYSIKYEEYKKILAENDIDYIETVQNDVFSLKNKISTIKNEFKQLLKLKREIRTLEITSFDLSKEIFKTSFKINSIRREIANRIQKKLNESNINVSIKLKREKNVSQSDYFKWLKKIHNPKVKNLLEKIHKKFLPFELARAILNEKTIQISESFPKNHRRIFEKLNTLTENSKSPKVFKSELIDLFKISLDSCPVISFKRRGLTRYYPLNRLSIGERCAILLYIMLLVKEMSFLVDQADSELDQESTQKFSEYLLQIKDSRQIIVATHNPNIPTLGDVDLLYHLDTLPSGNREIGIISKCGGFEECIDSIIELEGGRDAIKRRFKKYNENFF